MRFNYTDPDKKTSKQNTGAKKTGTIQLTTNIKNTVVDPGEEAL